MKTDLVKDFDFPNLAPVFLFVKRNLVFGFCKIDERECYAKGAICRLNRIAGFTTDYDYSNPQIRKPFRNKDCLNFRKVEK